MVVSGKSNGSYIFTTVLPKEFEAVSSPDYMTAVQKVDRPKFDKGDLAQIAEASSEGPAILLWEDSDDDISGVVGGPLRSICLLRVLVVGVVRSKDDIDQAKAAIASDIRRVMMGNKRRTFPGALDSDNTYGRLTRPAGSPNIEYAHYDIDGSTTVGIIYSLWDIEYWFPIATG